MKMPWIAVALILWAVPSQGAVVGSAVDYRHGDTILEGYLAYDDVSKEVRSGVLVVHEWYGLNDYARKRADQLAQLGYVAFALDMYGKGVRAADNKEAGALQNQRRSSPNARAGLGRPGCAQEARPGGSETSGGHRVLLRRDHGARTREGWG